MEEVGATTTVSSSSPLTRFVESTEFKKIRADGGFPRQIKEWSPSNVHRWATWAADTFPEATVNLDDWRWVGNGKSLCALTKADFVRSLVPKDPEGLLWNHFDILRRTGMATVPDFASLSPRPSSSSSTSSHPGSPSSSSSTSAPKTQGPPSSKKPRVVLGKYEQGNVLLNIAETGINRSGNNGISVQLWKFLLDILTDGEHRLVSSI